MNHERWKTVEALYLGALDAPDRAAYLEEACKGDVGLRQEVELLLQEDPTTVHLFDSENLSKTAAEFLLDLSTSKQVPDCCDFASNYFIVLFTSSDSQGKPTLIHVLLGNAALHI